MQPGRVRAVFFDAGGTLIYLDRRFLIERLAGHGLDVDDATFIAADRDATRHAVELMRTGQAVDDTSRWRAYGRRLLRTLGCGPITTMRVGRAIRARHAEGLLWSHIEPGTPETLRTLRARGYRLAVVSNADGRVASFLEHAGLDACFDEIIDSSEVGVEKPDPGIFRIACERVGVEPAHAVHIGDILEIDVVGARAAGVHPILFDPHDAFPDPDCDRIRAIPDLLERLPGVHDERRAASGG
jgi:HAD superfamily hydrolase (TIGR01662 family)